LRAAVSTFPPGWAFGRHCVGGEPPEQGLAIPRRNQNDPPDVLSLDNPGSDIMADGGNGGIGVLGVLVGALIVVVVGVGVLFATGNIGSKTSTVKLEVPKITTGAK